MSTSLMSPSPMAKCVVSSSTVSILPPSSGMQSAAIAIDFISFRCREASERTLKVVEDLQNMRSFPSLISKACWQFLIKAISFPQSLAVFSNFLLYLLISLDVSHCYYFIVCLLNCLLNICTFKIIFY